jgi:2-dehydropantoate 2-reductase
VRTQAGEFTAPVIAVGDTRGVAPVELALFSVKAYDTEAAARALKPLVAGDTTVLTLQNGLDHLEAIGAVVGAEAVIPGVVHVALQLGGPGLILHTGGEGRIIFGEVDGVETGRVRRLAEALQQSGLPHTVSPDIHRVLWEKFLFITGIGAVTALARSGIGPLRDSPEGLALLTAACTEIDAIARAEGAPLPADAVAATLAQAAKLPPAWRSSMARDLEDGRRLEVDALSGAVVRRGQKSAVPTPIHHTILACLSLHQPAR